MPSAMPYCSPSLDQTTPCIPQTTLFPGQCKRRLMTSLRRALRASPSHSMSCWAWHSWPAASCCFWSKSGPWRPSTVSLSAACSHSPSGPPPFAGTSSTIWSHVWPCWSRSWPSEWRHTQGRVAYGWSYCCCCCMGGPYCLLCTCCLSCSRCHLLGWCGWPCWTYCQVSIALKVIQLLSTVSKWCLYLMRIQHKGYTCSIKQACIIKVQPLSHVILIYHDGLRPYSCLDHCPGPWTFFHGTSAGGGRHFLHALWLHDRSGHRTCGWDPEHPRPEHSEPLQDPGVDLHDSAAQLLPGRGSGGLLLQLPVPQHLRAHTAHVPLCPTV